MVFTLQEPLNTAQFLNAAKDCDLKLSPEILDTLYHQNLLLPFLYLDNAHHLQKQRKVILNPGPGFMEEGYRPFLCSLGTEGFLYDPASFKSSPRLDFNLSSDSHPLRNGILYSRFQILGLTEILKISELKSFGGFKANRTSSPSELQCELMISQK